MYAPVRFYLWTKKMYQKRFGKIAAKLLWRLNRVIFSCEIDPSADIAPSVETPHNLLGCVIGSDVVIGEGTKILQNVTIGGRNGRPEMPVIGSNVMIGAGAVILGKVRIGDRAKIGANAVVLQDVPADAAAVGVPAKIIEKAGKCVCGGGNMQ